MASLLVDIDHFKRYNDHHGHPAGDGCLRRIARLLCDALRKEYFGARLGGEELAVLLRRRSEPEALRVAQHLRRCFEQAGISHDGRQGRQIVSISIGLALSVPHRVPLGQELIAAADSALYQAKGPERNCCFVQRSSTSAAA